MVVTVCLLKKIIIQKLQFLRVRWSMTEMCNLFDIAVSPENFLNPLVLRQFCSKT